MFTFACYAIDEIFMFNLIFDLVSTPQEKQDSIFLLNMFTSNWKNLDFMA